MAEYRVMWVIDCTADSPREAAEWARDVQLDPDSTATHFVVSDQAPHGQICNVDLMEDEDDG